MKDEKRDTLEARLSGETPVVRELALALDKELDRATIAAQRLAEVMAQRDHEAWMHASCLSIAEGVPGWRDCVEDSLAIKAVKALRAEHEALAARATQAEAERDDLRRRVENLRARLQDVARVKELEERARTLEGALRALVDAHDWGYINRGIGTATPVGKRWLAARAALSTSRDASGPSDGGASGGGT